MALNNDIQSQAKKYEAISRPSDFNSRIDCGKSCPFYQGWFDFSAVKAGNASLMFKGRSVNGGGHDALLVHDGGGVDVGDVGDLGIGGPVILLSFSVNSIILFWISDFVCLNLHIKKKRLSLHEISLMEFEKYHIFT